MPENLLTEDDVEKLIDAAENPRDKAFIALLWETGARIDELIDLNVGSFEDRKQGIEGEDMEDQAAEISDIKGVMEDYPDLEASELHDKLIR